MSATQIQIADPELIEAFQAGIAFGNPTDHKTLAKALERPRADNVKRALERAEKAGIITLDPPAMTPAGREALGINVETHDAPPKPDAPAPAGIVETNAAARDTITVTIDQLTPSPFNPRKHFDAAALEELADSIHAKGLLQSPLARPHPDKLGKFQIAAGERRRRAMVLLAARGEAGRSAEFDPDSIEIKVRQIDDADMIMIGILENSDRVDPSPIEEAEAFVQLRDLIAARDPESAGKATQIIATSLGKTRRHVQLRIALAEKLVEQARAMLTDGRLTLAKARALAEIPAPIQAEICKDISAGRDWNYKTADDIRGAMKDAAFPASKARFDRDTYLEAAKNTVTDPAEAVWIDPDTDAEFYTIRPLVERLQGEALDAIKAELEGKRAFVHVTDYFSDFRYPKATDQDAGNNVGAVIEYHPHHLTLIVHDKRTLPREDAAKIEKKEKQQADAEKRKQAAAAVGVDLAPQPYARKNWIGAKQAKTATLQEHIAAAPGQIAAALAIIGLIDHHPMQPGAYSDAETVKIRKLEKRGEDRDIGRRGFVRAAIKDLAAGHPEAFELTKTGVVITNPAAAFKALVTSKAIGQIFSATIAEQVGSWADGMRAGCDAGPGDTALILAIVEELDITAAEYNTDADYFAQFSRGTIGMMAKHAGADPASLPKTRRDAAEALSRCARARTMAAPEMRFDTPEAIAADVERLLNGTTTPKGGAK